MRLTVAEEDVRRKAVDLGLIEDGAPLPAALRSRVVAVLLQEQAPRMRQTDTPVAASIRVQPGGGVEVDGRPFPWVVQADTIEVTLDPSGAGLVRLTIPTKSVEIIKSESEHTT
ncbi:hypothetical protein [Streptomyces sp. NPDC014685]|uniref:hypothetical protein n=1 Tax=Streptomyces sp. NPDC014685 TaxID=3364881 RepID=UPI0036FE6A11